MIGLYGPEAIGMLVTAERRQQRGTERDEEDCEESARRPILCSSDLWNHSTAKVWMQTGT